MIEKFKNYMLQQEKTENTIQNYVRNVNQYIKWFEDTTGKEFNKL